MAEEIRFDIVADFNTESLDSLTNYVSKARDEIVGMKKDLRDSMDGMDAPARLLAEQLDRCVATADQLAQKTTETSKAVRQDVMSEDTKREEAARINNMLADFNAMKTALTGDGAYSVTLAKQMLSGLPGAVQQEFSAIAPQVVSAMRRGFNSLNRGNQKITGTTADAMVQDAMDLTEIQSLLRGTSATQAQKEGFVRSLLMNATQVQRTAEYQNARFGHTVKQTSLPTRVEEILPELYKGAYANQGFVSGTSFAGKQNAAQGLSVTGTSKLLQLIQNNPVAARAAETSGLMHRNGAGALTLDQGVTRGRLLDFSSSLWDEFHTRTRGLTNRFDDYYATSASEKERDAIEKRIVQRAYSGTGGTTLAAMQVVSDLLAQEQFADKVGQVHRVIDPNTEAKRLKEQYTVEKLTPFSPVDPTGSKKVTLAESQMTRMLGMQGHNYQDLDAVKLISLVGYDASNPEHVQRFRELQEQGYTGSQGHYSVHAMHGTGENTVLRMIRDQERQAITARYTPFAQQLGLAGTDVFNAFVPTNMEFKDPAALGKHMEQLNKMWTDSYVLGSDISGKKFAFVDFSQDKDHQFSDGLGFMGKGILPGAIQARFGLSGKGSFYEMGTETVGEWAKNAGRLDDQGRYMVKGIDGTMFDASQYHGLIDISQMKNLAAYNGLNNAQANTALTAMLREFPIAAVADYNYDGDAAGLGPQMMTFLAMSPAMQQHQATNVAQRLRDLQTLEGQRRYVFNNPESDIVSRMANDPVRGDKFMVSDPRVKDRVDTYVDSLMRRSASGEFINFNDIANIQNERLLRSPIVADFMTRGGMTDAEVAHYQDIFQKVHGREFTPEEVRRYMTLEGGVADFGHEDASQVAALRSPTGFGQLLVRENYASMLRPVLEYLGETPTGFHANNEDYKTLAGADMDADEVKAIADKANKLGPDKSQLSLVGELAKVKEIADSYGISAKEAEVLTHALPALAGGNNIGNTENWLRMAALSIKAPMEMGIYSDVGSRLAGNLDLFDQTMRPAAVIATKANNGYDPATTLNKKPAEIEHDKQVYAALRLGQEYQKIPAHIKDVYNVDSHYDEKSDSTYYTTKDGETPIDPKDIFKTSNGRLMNLSYFRGMDGTRLDKTNLPSVLSTPMLGAMLGAKINSELGLADSTLTTDLLEAFGVKEVEGPKVGEGVSFNGAGEATKALMANKRAMLAQFIGQQRFSISDQERDVLASQYAASMEEIEKEAASKLEQGGVIKDENGKYVGRQQYVSTQARKFGLDQVALMLGMYKGPDGQLLNTGLTQSNIEAKYGANFAQALQNGAGVTLPYMTPAVFSPEYQRYATYYNRGQVGAQHVASAQAPVIQQPEQQQQQQQAAQNPPTPPTTPPGSNNPPNNNPAYDPAVLEAKFESMRAGSREDMQELLRGESAIEAAQNIIEDARKFKSSMSKERYSDRELTAAQKWYGSNKGYLQYLQNAYDEFDQKGHSAIAGNSAIAVQAKNAIADAQYEFVEARDTHARKAMTDSTERLDRLINGRGTEADAQLEKVAKWDEVIDGVISERSEYLKSLGDIEDKMSGKNGQSRSDNRLQEFDQQIDMLQERRDQGFENLIKENAQMFEDVTASFDKMIEGKDRSPQAKIQRTLEKARTDLTQKDQTLDDFYNKGLLKKEDYDRIKADYAARFGKLDDGTYQAQLESYLNVNQELSQLQHDMQLNQFMRQGSTMSRNMYGQNRGIIGRALANREQALTSWQNRKVAAEKQLAAETKARDKIDKDKDPEAYAKATDNINALQQASDQASSAIEKLSDPMATAASVAAQFGDVVGRLATRLGRQLFRKALNEAKKFVQEFDKSMTTIQMITLKSDSQMSTLGDGLIAKAKELKISISEITQSAETLYRQGLSDEEVDERLDIISKFSKVSGTKVDAATKLITVAMNTGLVSDPQVAADIVTALGDNAATNASEIEKGIEKAGAAAAADGTTFAQLASMLTAITSTTQIGGNVAGRTLNTIFGRMNKIGTSELIVDENGNKVSGSAVAKLLKAQDVDTYDIQGNKRSSYDVLYDLSQKWEGMSDAEQQQIATAIAGTRQYSNFAAIMQGMSEGKVSEYMDLTGKSTGIVDEKFEIYVKSLQASLTDLKNTYDELIHDLTNSGTLTGVIDFFTSMIKGVDNLTNSMGGLGAALTTVLPMLVGLGLLKAGLSTANIGLIAGGAAALAVGGGIAAVSGNQKTASERNAEYEEEYNERISKYSDIDRLKELRSNTNRTEAENTEYATLINKYAKNLGLTNDAASDATYGIDSLTSALQKLSPVANEAADNVIKEAEEEKKREFAANISNTRATTVEELAAGAKEQTAELNKTIGVNNTLLNGRAWGYDEEKGGYYLYDDALSRLNSLVKTGTNNDTMFGAAGVLSGWLGGSTISYNKDLEGPLTDLFLNAAVAGRMGDFERSTTRSQWSNRIKAGAITQEQLDAAFEYMDRSAPVDSNSFAAKESKSKEILSRKLGTEYDEDQIDYLAHKMALSWHQSGNADTAYAGIVGEGTSYDEITGSVNKALEGYVPTNAVQKNQYGLEPLGKYDYYVDETGKVYSEEEANAYYKGLETTNKERAVGIMQAHNRVVIDEFETNKARVEAENEAAIAEAKATNDALDARFEEESKAERQQIEAQYQSDLLAEAKRLYSASGSSKEGFTAAEEAYFQDLLTSYYGGKTPYMTEEAYERAKYLYRGGQYGGADSFFENQSQEVQDKYIAQTAVDNWDSLTEDEQDYYYELARDNVKRMESTLKPYEHVSAKLKDVPELDESKLIGGVNATAESLGKLYDENGEILQEVADEIDAANEKAAKDAKTITKKTHTFVESLDVYSIGDKGFATKNQAAISSDNITALLMSGQFGTGAEGLLNFMNYIESNANAEADWTNAINNNTELQRIMHQASYDTKTGTWTAPEDIMTQMLYATQSGSLTYGAAALTTQQKANLAQQAYAGLTENSWFVSQEAKDAAQESAWAQYQENVNKSLAAIDNNKTMTAEQKEAAKAAILSGYGSYATQEEFVASQLNLNAAAMNSYQQQYLKEALGEQMYARVLEANAGGKALTDEEKALAQLQLSNRAAGLTSLASRQQLDWLNQANLSTLGKENGLSRAVADTYMSQWSGWNEYAALIEAQNTGNTEAFTSLGGQERLNELTQSLENFKKDAQIKIDIEGTQALEEAGKVADGTAAKLEKLQKGGHVAIEVEMQLRAEAYESGQTRAKLYGGGTSLEQAESAMSTLQMSREEYYSRVANGEDLIAEAQRIDAENNQVLDAETWSQLYLNTSGTTRQAMVDAARRSGFEQVYDTNGHPTGQFKYVGGNSVTRVGALAGTEQKYSDAQLAAAREQLLNGTLTQADNPELFAAAEQSLGAYGQQYQWYVENPEAEISDTQKERLRQQALYESSEILRQQNQTQRASAIEYEKAALAAADVNKAESRATLASYLGIDEDRVLELAESKTTGADGGEFNALADMLANKRSNLVRGIAEGLEAEFKDLDSATTEMESLDLGDVTDFESLISGLRNAAKSADDATAKRLNELADAYEGAKSAAETDFSEAFKQAQSRLKENTYEYKGSDALQQIVQGYNPETNGNFWDYVKTARNENGNQIWNNDWNTAVTGNNGIVAAMSLLSSGALTNTQFTEFITQQMNGAGKNHDYYDLIAQAALGNNYKNGEFVTEGLTESLEKIKLDENLLGFYNELISKFPELEDAAKRGGLAIKALNENWKADKTADVAKYAKGVNGLSDIMTGLAQGGNQARKAEMQLNAELTKLQDQQTAVTKARGKSGKELEDAKKKKGDQTLDMLASLVPYDADQLANMSAEELNKIIDEAAPLISEDFGDTIQSLFSMLPISDVDVNLSDLVKVHADGSVELTDVANVLTDAEERILQMILQLVGKYADIDIAAILNGDKVTVESFISSLRKAGVKGGGGYSRKSSGGGGGGKSAAQAAIDAAKHYAAEAQHMTKMAEADLYHPDKMNDFAGYAGAVQANVFTLQQEGQVWRDQIAYLEEQRSKVKEGTDDWWSLTEAINGYTESLAGLEEQIDNINAKLLEEAKEEFGYKITAAQHRLTMGTTDRTFYQRTNDYDKELESIDSLNVEYGVLEETYREAIAMYKALQGNVEEGTDQWWTYQQEIDSTTESLAELKNTVAQLNAEKLGIYIEKQENEDKPENNAYALMDLYKTRYLNNEDYTAYETLMEERKTLLAQSINSNATQVRELEMLLSEFEEGSDEWISARDQIWSIKLDTATKENEYIELEKELAEQRLAQISQSYERETAYENHAVTMYDTYGNMYKAVSNYAGYQSTLRQQVSMFEDIKSAAETARDAALEEMASLEKGTPEWYNARDAVYKYEEAIATTYASIMEKKFAIEESLANALIESYTDDMSLFDQQAKLLESQRKKYDNHNDYGGYITTLREENKVLQEQTDSRREYLAQLQDRLANTTIGTDAWKNLRKEILSVEQAISSAEVTLDNFEQELEKSKIDYYLEKMERAQSNRTHALTMIQYEETKYQNAGELSNYGIMLEKENEQRQKNTKALERDIALLNEELDQVEKGSKQYQRLIDAIKKKEEAIAADSNAIEKNNKLLEENQNKIKQTRKTLEDQVDAEIKKRKEQAKTELNATVQLQNQILNTIKERYRQEWDLQKQDTQKKKDALNEEKQLINERLEARKSAMNAEDKYEELRDLQQQLALLSNDPTRTKEAKELSKKIADIRKDISWDRAAEEAETATERIDDEIRAMDEWIQVNEENLNAMLEDAHNFSEEINSVLSGSYEDIISWMMENNTAFKNSLDEAQQQMIEGWETTWKTMHGIVDTYWDQINDILSSKDNFIKFMQESVDYITASEAGKATMLYAWSKGYDTMFGAESVDESLYNYEAHDHEEDEVGKVADEIAAAMTEALEWTYNSDWWAKGLTPSEDLLASVIGEVESYNDLGLPNKGSDLVPTLEEFMDKYAGVGVVQDNTPPSSYAQVNVGKYTAKTDTSSYRVPSGGGSGKSSSGSGSGSKSSTDTKETTDHGYSLTVDGVTYNQGGFSTEAEAQKASNEFKKSMENELGTSAPHTYDTKVYATGGLVDYTGPAWVDGTPTQPEAFLSAYDTEQIGKLAEALRYVYVSPGFAPSEKYFGNSTTVGDIVININQAELKDDADYEEVARRVGAAFTKQLSKEGLTLTGYSF